jgi:hypothetical protein
MISASNIGFVIRSVMCVGIVIGAFLDEGRASESEAIYQRRIVPLLQADRPSSCSACHFRGVRLDEFFHEDSAATFAELRSRGWIDVKKPEESKILGFLSKKTESADPQSLHEKVRVQEFEAVRDWIEAAAMEPELIPREPAVENELVTDAELMRHGRFDQATVRFIDAIWSQLGRCINCHSPLRNKKLVEEHGESISWIVPNDPQATLLHLRDAKLIDVDKAEQSLIRTKPTALVEHGGGPKFLVDSETDTQWLAFLTDLAETIKIENGYRGSDSLPTTPRRSWLSELQMRIVNIPAELANKHLIVKVRRSGSAQDERESLVAVAESLVNDKQNLWQNAFTIYSRSSVEEERSIEEAQQPIAIADAVPEGEYVVEVWLKEPQGKVRILGQSTILAPWPPGYQPPKIVEWKDVIE